MTEFRIALGVFIGILISNLFPTIQSLAVCTAIIMVTQTSDKVTFKSGLTRLLGVISGGMIGILIVLLNEMMTNNVLIFAIEGMGILVNFLSCRLLKLPMIAARVSCITLVLVVLVMPGLNRLEYAVDRGIGTIIGIAITLVLSYLSKMLLRFFTKKK